jgi:hypothetical protein
VDGGPGEIQRDQGAKSPSGDGDFGVAPVALGILSRPFCKDILGPAEQCLWPPPAWCQEHLQCDSHTYLDITMRSRDRVTHE